MDASGIEYILEQLGCQKIRQKNSTIFSTCPFAPYAHAKGVDRNPSFGVEINGSGTSQWGCFACKNAANQTYSLIYRMADYTGNLDENLLAYIREREGMSLSYRLSQMEWRPSRPIQNPQYVPARILDYEPTFHIENYRHVLSHLPQYALDRGITPAQARKWNIGYLWRGLVLADGYECKMDRLFFTLMSHDQRMVGWSGRILDDQFTWASGDKPAKYHHAAEIKKERYLYGENLVDRSVRYGFVTESFMDVLRLDLYGVKNPLAIMGANASFEQITKLSTWFDKVFIMQQNDKAGRDMAVALEAALRMVGTDAEIVEPLEGRKDNGEWSYEETARVMNSLGVPLESGQKTEETAT